MSDLELAKELAAYLNCFVEACDWQAHDPVQEVPDITKMRRSARELIKETSRRAKLSV